MLHCKKATKAMTRLEALQAGAYIKGLIPGGTAKVIHLEGFGDQTVKITYEDPQGHVSHRLVFR